MLDNALILPLLQYSIVTCERRPSFEAYIYYRRWAASHPRDNKTPTAYYRGPFLPSPFACTLRSSLAHHRLFGSPTMLPTSPHDDSRLSLTPWTTLLGGDRRNPSTYQLIDEVKRVHCNSHTPILASKI
eukprot:scaffold57855_cov41-Prasinocladus_malaysianus.AAC.1